MSTETITCYKLHCDAKVSDDCAKTLTDHDTEGDIHGSTPEEIRNWATGSSYEFDWITVSSFGDVCPACRRKLDEQDHAFTPDSPGSSICALCKYWATDGHGLEVVPGQTEIAAASPVSDREQTTPDGGEGSCGSCGGTRWVDDQNWQPEDYERAQGRVIGSGRIPCGLCNHGGWNVPDGAVSGAAQDKEDRT